MKYKYINFTARDDSYGCGTALEMRLEELGDTGFELVNVLEHRDLQGKPTGDYVFYFKKSILADDWEVREE